MLWQYVGSSVTNKKRQMNDKRWWVCNFNTVYNKVKTIVDVLHHKINMVIKYFCNGFEILSLVLWVGKKNKKLLYRIYLGSLLTWSRFPCRGNHFHTSKMWAMHFLNLQCSRSNVLGFFLAHTLLQVENMELL